MHIPLRFGGGYILILMFLFVAFGWLVFRPRRTPAAPRPLFVTVIGTCALLLSSFACARFFYSLVFDNYPYYIIDILPSDWPDYPFVVRLLVGVAASPVGFPIALLFVLFVITYALAQLTLIVKRRLGLEPGPFRKFEWPQRGMGALLPQPTQRNGRIDKDDSNGFIAEVDDVSFSDFESYCERCVEEGFILPGFTPPSPWGRYWKDSKEKHAAKMTPIAYSGGTPDGYELELTLNAEFLEVMTIRLQKGSLDKVNVPLSPLVGG